MAPVPLLRPRAVLTERFEVDRKIGEGTFSILMSTSAYDELRLQNEHIVPLLVVLFCLVHLLPGCFLKQLVCYVCSIALQHFRLIRMLFD
jgi:hypothetical protein